MERKANDTRQRHAINYLKGQKVKAYLGIKKYQVPRENVHRQTIRKWLKNQGINVLDIIIFLKTKSGKKPPTDQNVINIFLRFTGENSIEIIF
ncbi:MAG: hypothetical protein WC349_00180 [Patescibacteria group bacterium]|jgi:hypothetical protein